MFNDQKAIAVRIYEKNLNDYAEFLFEDGSFVKINISNCGYKCFDLLTNHNTLFYDERIDIYQATAYDVLHGSEFNRAIEIESNNSKEDSINFYMYKLIAPPTTVWRSGAFTGYSGERADNVLHTLINNAILDSVIHGSIYKLYFFDMRILNKPKFEDLKKEIDNFYADDVLE